MIIILVMIAIIGAIVFVPYWIGRYIPTDINRDDIGEMWLWGFTFSFMAMTALVLLGGPLYLIYLLASYIVN